MQLSLQEIARVLGADVPESLGGRQVTGACSDSRKVLPGSLFACIKGEKVDGHDFALSALERGAACVLCERGVEGLEEKASEAGAAVFFVQDSVKALGALAAFWRERFKGKLVAVTGSAGKTTVKELLAQTLAQKGSVAKTEKNHNNQLGLPLSMLAARGDEDFWVMEAGISHAGDMEELGAMLRPDLALVLNAGQGHTEGLGEKGVAWHKARLFAFLKEGGIAVASMDYPELVECALEAVPEARFFSAEQIDASCLSCDEGVRDGERPLGVFGTIVDINGPFEGRRFLAPVFGRAGAEDVAAVTLVCRLLGLSMDQIAKGLEGAALPAQRYARRTFGKVTLIDDTYNANPLSMSRMLDSAFDEADRSGRPLAVVLGMMGELGSEAVGAHKDLGRHLADIRPAVSLWRGAYFEDVASQGCDVVRLENEEDLLDRLEPLLSSPVGAVVLFKGSRSNRLETFVEAVEARLKEAGV